MILKGNCKQIVRKLNQLNQRKRNMQITKNYSENHEVDLAFEQKKKKKA